MLGEWFSETDGVKPAVPFFFCRLLELQNFSFVAPQGRSDCPLSDVSVVGSVCQLVDFLISSTQRGPQMQHQACQSAKRWCERRGSLFEICKSLQSLVWSACGLLRALTWAEMDSSLFFYNLESCCRRERELPDWVICIILSLLSPPPLIAHLTCRAAGPAGQIRGNRRVPISIPVKLQNAVLRELVFLMCCQIELGLLPALISSATAPTIYLRLEWDIGHADVRAG